MTPTLAPAETAIATTALAKSYGLRSQTVALHPTTLAVGQGSIYALLGHNGAGKTTLLKLLMNILHPTSGDASVVGHASTALAGDDFSRIGYVSENQELPGWMTVGNFLAYQSGFYPHWDDAALIRRFDLPLGRKLKHLSRGQRMKVALASILAFQPSLIVLDEPFSGLDPLVRDELIEALLDAAATKPVTILLSSHDLAEIESFCTHVAFLHSGHLLFAEEMPALSARFREVTVTLSEPPESEFMPRPQSSYPEASASGLIGAPEEAGFSPSGMPSSESPQFPSTWLLPQHTAHTLRFIHTQANTEPIAEQVRSLFPNATAIELEPMNLRSIFLAIAKSGRTVTSTEGAR
jgi:ABC-2 type transport system ATP-binding protein